MKSQDLAQLKMPDAPGVYFFRLGDKILYIGKATSLRDRVRSYFGPDLIATRGPLLVDMVTRAGTVTWQETGSVLEALILEAALIKRYKPHYNTREKDDKSYYYVAITKQKHPIVLIERGKNIDQKRKCIIGDPKLADVKLGHIFGPFPHGPQLREAMRILRRIFPFDDLSSMKRAQRGFYQQLELAPGDRDERYRETIQNLGRILSGKLGSLVKDLEKQMKQAAKAEDFELAQQMKRKVFALTHIRDVSLIKRDLDDAAPHTRIEAYDVAHTSGSAMIGVMAVVIDGEPSKKDYRSFIIRSVKQSNDPAALREMLARRFKHPEWGMPDLIVVDGNDVQRNVALGVLSEIGISVPVVALVKDERHKPKGLLGEESVIQKHKQSIVLTNSEAHRFAVATHSSRRMRASKGMIPRK